MKQIVLRSIAFIICFLGVTRAQQPSIPAPPKSATEPAEKPPMTPRQVAEMRADILMAAQGIRPGRRGLPANPQKRAEKRDFAQ